MHIEVSYRDIPRTESIDARVHESLTGLDAKFGGRVTRVEVHIGDHNAFKPGGDDKRCMMEARPARMHPIAVEAEGEDLYEVIHRAARKLERAITRRLERRRSRQAA